MCPPFPLTVLGRSVCVLSIFSFLSFHKRLEGEGVGGYQYWLMCGVSLLSFKARLLPQL